MPGKADTEFAKRYGHLAGKPVKTVGEAFAEFTKELGFSVNALYKTYVTDIVATTHLIVINVRFQRDPIWSLGLIASLDLLLKNYPERDIAEKITSSLFKAVEIDEAEARAEAKALLEWAEGKTLKDIEAAMDGEGDSAVAEIARKAKVGIDRYESELKEGPNLSADRMINSGCILDSSALVWSN